MRKPGQMGPAWPLLKALNPGAHTCAYMLAGMCACCHVCHMWHVCVVCVVCACLAFKGGPHTAATQQLCPGASVCALA